MGRSKKSKNRDSKAAVPPASSPAAEAVPAEVDETSQSAVLPQAGNAADLPESAEDGLTRKESSHTEASQESRGSLTEHYWIGDKSWLQGANERHSVEAAFDKPADIFAAAQEVPPRHAETTEQPADKDTSKDTPAQEEEAEAAPSKFEANDSAVATEEDTSKETPAKEEEAEAAPSKFEADDSAAVTEEGISDKEEENKDEDTLKETPANEEESAAAPTKSDAEDSAAAAEEEREDEKAAIGKADGMELEKNVAEGDKAPDASDDVADEVDVNVAEDKKEPDASDDVANEVEANGADDKKEPDASDDVANGVEADGAEEKNDPDASDDVADGVKADGAEDKKAPDVKGAEEELETPEVPVAEFQSSTGASLQEAVKPTEVSSDAQEVAQLGPSGLTPKSDISCLDVETLPPVERSFAPAAEHTHSAEVIVGSNLGVEKESLALPEGSGVLDGAAAEEWFPDAEEWFPPGPTSLDPQNVEAHAPEATTAGPLSSEPAMMLFPSNCPDGTVYLSSLQEVKDPSPGFVDDEEDEHEQLGQKATDEGSRTQDVIGLDKSILAEQLMQSASASSGVVQVDLKSQGNTHRAQGTASEEMADLLRVREAELRQMRADYEARVRRSADLRTQLEDQGDQETPASLRVAVAETKGRIEARELSMCRSMTAGEDFLAQGLRLLHAKDQEINFLERRVLEVQAKTQRLVHAREPVSDTVAEEALQEKQQQIVALKADSEAQEEKLTGLSSDLRSILDYMMRVNIEAVGGPARDLTANEFLPEEVRAHLTFSEHTQTLVGDLISKYEACMAQCQERATSSRAEPPSGQHGLASESYDRHASRTRLQGGLEPSAGRAARQGMSEADLDASAAAMKRALKPSVVTGLGPMEKPTTSFAQEAKLLRELFAVEMRSVSCALAEEDAAMRGNAKLRHILVNRELLRAAAWGDEGTLQELLPVVSKSQLTWPLSTKDPQDTGVKGWTPWHAAAAHGQCGALAVLQKHLSRIGVPRNMALQQLTDSGFPPLAVACFRGQVEVVKTLLQSQAPLDACGTRGNTSLHWAAAASSEGAREVLVQVLLMANADPDMPNGSGQCIDPTDMNNNSARASLGSARGSVDQLASSRQSITSKAGDPLAHQTDLEPYIEHVHDPYHIIEAVGVQQSQQERGFLSYTLSMLKVPVRDGVGFARIDHAKMQARLSLPENEMGVWSDWVSNYTHAGLRGAVDATQPAASPTLQVKSRQALVLTCERLLFFNAANWSLVMVVPISDVVQVQLFSYSSTVLLLRTSGRPDILIDMSARSRFLDELQVAGLQFSNRWGGEDFADQAIPITTMPQLIVTLSDEQQEPAGVIAFVETNVFLLIPFVPSSLLLAGAKTAFFGFLDVQRSARPVERKKSSGRWQGHFFVLKEGVAHQRKLLWCHHPNDEEAIGQVAISSIWKIDTFETLFSEPCFAIDYPSKNHPNGLAKLTLRASSAQCREDWISSINALVGDNLRH